MLIVCATDIGNFDDNSTRLRDIISQADVIAAEDTRRALFLLKQLGISPPSYLLRLDQHKEKIHTKIILDHLEQKRLVVLLSDAGSPCISDPGAYLINACIEAGFNISPLPGPSAVTSLLSVGGFKQTMFVFAGFFPRQTTAARTCLFHLSSIDGPIVFFESPKRLLKTFSLLKNICPEARCVCAKELSKEFETILYGTVSAVENDLHNLVIKGEWCFAIDLPDLSLKKFEDILPSMIKLGLNNKQILGVSKLMGFSKSMVYHRLHLS